MAISVVASSSMASQFAATSITSAYNVTTGDAIFVGASTYSVVTVSAATYNSETMLSGNGVKLFDGGNDSGTGIKIYGFLLLNPDTGNNNVVLTWSASCDSCFGVEELLGVDQTIGSAYRTVPSIALGGGGSTDPTVTVAASQSDDLVIDVLASFSTTITIDGGQSNGIEVDNLFGGTWSIGISTKAATGASTVMSWTSNASPEKYWQHCAVALVPAAGGGGGAAKVFIVGDLSGIGSPGRFFKDRLQRMIKAIHFYRLDPT